MDKINNKPGEVKTKMFTQDVVDTSLEQKEKDASFNPIKLR